jgi:hypothetical protein
VPADWLNEATLVESSVIQTSMAEPMGNVIPNPDSGFCLKMMAFGSSSSVNTD